jgi:hypothetical protein
MRFSELKRGHPPTILIMRKGGEIPFDLRSFNVLFYENVTRLRDALTSRLEMVLHLSKDESAPE